MDKLAFPQIALLEQNLQITSSRSFARARRVMPALFSCQRTFSPPLCKSGNPCESRPPTVSHLLGRISFACGHRLWLLARKVICSCGRNTTPLSNRVEPRLGVRGRWCSRSRAGCLVRPNQIPFHLGAVVLVSASS